MRLAGLALEVLPVFASPHLHSLAPSFAKSVSRFHFRVIRENPFIFNGLGNGVRIKRAVMEPKISLK